MPLKIEGLECLPETVVTSNEEHIKRGGPDKFFAPGKFCIYFKNPSGRIRGLYNIPPKKIGTVLLRIRANAEAPYDLILAGVEGAMFGNEGAIITAIEEVPQWKREHQEST